MNRVLHLDGAQSARRKRSPWGWLVLGLIVPGCLVDSKDRCGPNETLFDNYLCACAEGTAYTPDGCVPCGDHEVSSPTGCVCEAGYGRSAATDPCAPIPPGLGEVCSADADCPNPFRCEMSAVGGYCTILNCSPSAPCPGDFNCDSSGSPPFCKRPPLGKGTACTSDADCAGFEATFCDTFVTHGCLVRDCNLATNDCFPGTECCDLSSFGLPNLCIQEGQCQPN